MHEKRNEQIDLIKVPDQLDASFDEIRSCRDSAACAPLPKGEVGSRALVRDPGEGFRFT